MGSAHAGTSVLRSGQTRPSAIGPTRAGPAAARSGRTRTSTVRASPAWPATIRSAHAWPATIRSAHAPGRHARRATVRISLATSRGAGASAARGDSARRARGRTHRRRGHSVRAGRGPSGNRGTTSCGTLTSCRTLPGYAGSPAGAALRPTTGAGGADRGTAGCGSAHRRCGAGARRKRRGAPAYRAGVVGSQAAVPAGVLLGLGGEATRSIGAGRTPAGPCLLGNGHGARAMILAGLRSTRAPAGTRNHPGGAVGHRAGTARNHRGAGALTARYDRRDHGRASHRPPVTGADATRTRHVRGSGETAGFGLVGVGTLMRVTAAAFLAPGEAFGSGPALRATANDVLGAGVASGLHEPVRAGIRAGLHEPVRTGVRTGLHEPVRAGVRTGLHEPVRTAVGAGLNESVGTAAGPQRAVRRTVPTGPLVAGIGRRGMSRTVGGVTINGMAGWYTTTGVPPGRSLGGAFLDRGPAGSCPPGTFAVRTGPPGRRRGAIGAGSTPIALLVDVRDGPGLMHGVIASRDRTGLMNTVTPTRKRTRLVNTVTAARKRTRLVNSVVAGRDRAGPVVDVRDGPGLVHGVVAGRDRARLMDTVGAAG
jgi:hypothetical protein